MAASNETLTNIIQRLIYSEKDMTVVEMAKQFDVSVATIRSAVSFGIFTRQIVKHPTAYPFKYKGLPITPEPGSTVIIHDKPVPPVELDAKKQKFIKEFIADNVTPPGNLGLIFECYYKILTPVGKQEFISVLYNFAAVVKEVVENETEIDPSDLAL